MFYAVAQVVDKNDKQQWPQDQSLGNYTVYCIWNRSISVNTNMVLSVKSITIKPFEFFIFHETMTIALKAFDKST